jgi:ATP-binding cassette subfamily B protein
MVLTMATMLFSAGILTLIPVFIGKLVGVLGEQPVNTHDAWFYAWMLVACSLGHNLTWRLGEFMYRHFVNPISFRYETHLFKAVIAQPYPYFVDKFTGKISSYIATLRTEFHTFLDQTVFNYTASSISILAVFFILSSINWQTGAVFACGIVCMLLVGRYTLRKSMRYQKVETDINATKNGHIIDAIANFTSVKAFRTEAREITAIHNEQQRTIAASRQAVLWIIIFWGSMSVFVRDFIWPVVVIMNLISFLHGTISLADFTTVLSTALIFTATVWDAVYNISQFGLTMAKTDEAHTYLFGNQVVKSETDAAKESGTSFHKTFEIRELTFAYPDKPDEEVLHDISLSLKQGEKLGIVGRSGSGKSTLTKLLLDYYEVKNEPFYFDDKSVPSETVARSIAFVPQDTTLFHRSIAENISYGSPEDVTNEMVIAAAKQAEADEFIIKLADGYDTLVGERGVKLSGGQRQRIAIARAILRDAPILVLDEATSSLDSESELHIQRALENLWHDKTVIAIAHRLSTLRKMDRIIVMDSGRIVEEGTHHQLLEQNGTYAKLWAHQSGGFIDE